MKGKPEILKYRYQSDGSLEILSYQPGTIGGQYQKDTVIRSCEEIDERACSAAWYMRCGRGRVWQKYGPSWRRFFIFGSTCEEYEDTAAHPAVIMHSVWDFSQVDVNAPGVYKVTGTFAAPEGCTVDQSLLFRGQLLILLFSARISRKYIRAVWLAWMFCSFL